MYIHEPNSLCKTKAFSLTISSLIGVPTLSITQTTSITYMLGILVYVLLEKTIIALPKKSRYKISFTKYILGICY